ncbi:hypothetical protein LTR17_013732 [Elasticomyces elasticus]|nr:hypothetical protein LTR17_013732 [Elasticomyces elasticus]
MNPLYSRDVGYHANVQRFGHYFSKNWNQCISQEKINKILNTLIGLFEQEPGSTRIAESVFSADFVEYSDSNLSPHGVSVRPVPLE